MSGAIPQVEDLLGEIELLRTALCVETGRREVAEGEVERLTRALGGHLFDGESATTRDEVRAVLIEDGFRAGGRLAAIRLLWDIETRNGRPFLANEDLVSPLRRILHEDGDVDGDDG